jgi:hypothetical protein
MASGAKGETETSPFVEHCTVSLPGASDGPLTGLTFTIKDLFDVKGASPYPTKPLVGSHGRFYGPALKPSSPATNRLRVLCNCSADSTLQQPRPQVGSAGAGGAWCLSVLTCVAVD